MFSTRLKLCYRHLDNYWILASYLRLNKPWVGTFYYTLVYKKTKEMLNIFKKMNTEN